MLIFPFALHGQSPDSSRSNDLNKRRLRIFTVGAVAAYGGAMAGLNKLWYENNGQTSFHFFNDNPEWKQVDKAGHFFSAFHISHGTSGLLRSFNVPQQKSDLIGALTGFGVLLPIEILDGHSKAYGASVGDLLANTGGAAFYFLQSRLWSEVRIHPKFSFHRTNYARLRPEVLGHDLAEELMKDYNGQTYWLSVDIDKFTPFPKWLNLAVGYGAQGMVYARDHQNIDAGFNTPYRQYYLSLDLDITAIHTNSKAVKTLLFLINMVKIPSPALSFSRKGVHFDALTF